MMFLIENVGKEKSILQVHYFTSYYSINMSYVSCVRPTMTDYAVLTITFIVV